MAPHLPTEILRNLFGYLSSADAINVLLVCREWKDACDDGAVWRRVLYQSCDLDAESLDRSNIKFESWRYYVRADFFAQSLQSTSPITDRVLTWLPHLVAIHRKCYSSYTTSDLSSIDASVLRIDKKALEKYVNRTNEYINTPKTLEKWIIEFGQDSTKLRTWRQALVASFCLTALTLDSNHPRRENSGHSLNSMKLKWAYFNTSDISSMSEYELSLITVIYHTLANQIVEDLILELRTHLSSSATSRFASTWVLPPVEDQPQLPTLQQIPFPVLMSPQSPLDPRSIQLFGTAHLKLMATPEFFTSGDWTGYFVEVARTTRFVPPEYRSPIRGGPPLPWTSCKGVGVFFDQFHRGGVWDHGAPFPLPLEDKLRFQLSHFVNNESQFVVMSNAFTTLGYAFQFVLTVDRMTGLVNAKGAYPSTLDLQGVITPFGLVLASNEGLWFWFWKKWWTL
jgi:hypothetical protein